MCSHRSYKDDIFSLNEEQRPQCTPYNSFYNMGHVQLTAGMFMMSDQYSMQSILLRFVYKCHNVTDCGISLCFLTNLYSKIYILKLFYFLTHLSPFYEDVVYTMKNELDSLWKITQQYITIPVHLKSGLIKVGGAL